MDISVLRHLLLAVGLSSVRLTAAATISPMFGGSLLQGQVKTSVMMALGLVVFPVIYPTVPEDLGNGMIVLGILVKEVILGIILGFAASIPFWTAQSVGSFIDNQRGASMASIMDPMSDSETSPVGQVLNQAVLVLFHSTGGLLIFLTALFQSYLIWPLNTYLPTFSNAFPGMMISLLDLLMRQMVVLGAPVIITMFLTEFGLGLVNRFAPSLNVFVLAMPVKSLVGVFVLIMYLPFLMGMFGTDLQKTNGLLDFMKNCFK